MEPKSKYVWIVRLESNVDGELMFDAIPCSSLKAARKVLQEQKEYILKESHHYTGFSSEEFEECFNVEESKDRYFISDAYDDYWEDYDIIKKKITD